MIAGSHRFPRQDAVVYGRPAHEAAIDLAKSFGAGRIFILTTRSLRLAAGSLAHQLGPLCVGVHDAIAAHSPRTDVLAGAAAARAANADLLLAFGGGSVIDATKLMQLCLWADLRTPESLDPYRLGRGEGRRDPSEIRSGARMIAIPTTLSAAEFTPFGGVTDTDRNVKEAWTHPDLAPRAVILDPHVTLETPARLWCSTGLKAVDHAVEQLCNPVRAPFADAVAAEGLKLLAEALPKCHAVPGDIEARARCQHGMWLAISGAASGRGMGASHAIGHTLGGSYGVPHGITSCVALPAVLQWNAETDALRQSLVSTLMGRPAASAATCVRDLAHGLGLPTALWEIGIHPGDYRAIAEHTMHDRGVRSNPRPITGPEDIVRILELAK